MNGYCGKMLFVDLTTKNIEEHELPKQIARQFIGGYGLGARVLFEMMKPGEDALGPGNVLGFVTGPLTGTGAVMSGRYTVVCKSPVTGGWNDSNSGGYFGLELKKAGYDAVFVSGASNTPVCLHIQDNHVEIRNADHLWGLDVEECEKVLKEDLGKEKLRAAVIGPAGEKLSPIAAIINDGHRAAGRGGSGAVMGSKKLKAVVVHGTGKAPGAADPDLLKKANQYIVDTLKNGPMAEVAKGVSIFGTTLFTTASALNGDSPVKNWGGIGVDDFGEETAKKFDGAYTDPKYRVKKFSCSGCAIGCGAIYDVKTGKWPVGKTARPEYESAAAFGVALLNADIEALMKCNHMCNIYGIDTISAGMTIAWATECFENGVLTEEDTGGIQLAWGNAEAVVQAMEEMAYQRTEFGKTIALGSEGAAKKLGKGFEYLITVKGIELAMHDPRFAPGFSRTYAMDPTPARHVKGGLGLGQMLKGGDEKYHYEGTGPDDVKEVAFKEVMNASGLCMFNDLSGVEDMWGKLLEPVTGWDFGLEEQMRTGMRIFHMRHAFNVREGWKPADNQLPNRCVGAPPMENGPLKGVTIDHKKLISNFFKAADIDENTGLPSKVSLERIGGLEVAIAALNL